jgi:hypothetical protein
LPDYPPGASNVKGNLGLFEVIAVPSEPQQKGSVGVELPLAGLVFIAAQAALAYGTSGFLKVPEKGWRNGAFVVDVLKTSSFGNHAH